jgi:hypothetical protein
MSKNIQAFPSDPFYVGDVRFSSEPGMTLRDYFAAKAIQGMLSSIETTCSFDDAAMCAYRYADAMLAAREAGE